MIVLSDEWLRSLADFVAEAKRNTYANPDVKPHAPGEYRYRKDSFSYRDVFQGENPFAGTESVFYNQRLVWVMNYHGGVTDESIDRTPLYGFLKKALALVPGDKPFRGPLSFKDGDYSYMNEVGGDIRAFSGAETILFRKQKKVMFHNYHGGLVIS